MRHIYDQTWRLPHLKLQVHTSTEEKFQQSYERSLPTPCIYMRKGRAESWESDRGGKEGT